MNEQNQLKSSKRRTDGVHAGGRPSLDSRPQVYYKNLLADYEHMTLRELARQYGLSRTTICKHLNYARKLLENE